MEGRDEALGKRNSVEAKDMAVNRVMEVRRGEREGGGGGRGAGKEEEGKEKESKER